MTEEKRRYLCVKDPPYCRSPTACDGFGYCRERNFDGTPMGPEKIARLRAQSDAVYAEFRGKQP